MELENQKPVYCAVIIERKGTNLELEGWVKYSGSFFDDSFIVHIQTSDVVIEGAEWLRFGMEDVISITPTISIASAISDHATITAIEAPNEDDFDDDDPTGLPF